MLQNEQLQSTEWKGHQWVVVRSDPFELKASVAIEKSPQVQLFDTLIPQAVTRISEILPLSDHTRKVRVALFPGSSYRNDLGLEENIPAWVKVCRRDEVTCYDVSIADKWPDTLDGIPADDRRELIHELAHEVHPFLSSDYLWTPLAIREGGVEVIARLLAKTQRELIDSNQFIRNDLKNQLIDPFILDREGLFARSKNPLSFNPGYLSVTAYVAGITTRLGNGDVKLGMQIMKSLAEKFKDKDQFANQLTSQLDGAIGSEEGRKLIQLTGINKLVE